MGRNANPSERFTNGGLAKGSFLGQGGVSGSGGLAPFLQEYKARRVTLPGHGKTNPVPDRTGQVSVFWVSGEVSSKPLTRSTLAIGGFVHALAVRVAHLRNRPKKGCGRSIPGRLLASEQRTRSHAKVFRAQEPSTSIWRNGIYQDTQLGSPYRP
jgi:hypothetical protein